MERLRNLCYLTTKREKCKKNYLELSRKCFEKEIEHLIAINQQQTMVTRRNDFAQQKTIYDLPLKPNTNCSSQESNENLNTIKHRAVNILKNSKGFPVNNRFLVKQNETSLIYETETLNNQNRQSNKPNLRVTSTRLSKSLNSFIIKETTKSKCCFLERKPRDNNENLNQFLENKSQIERDLSASPRCKQKRSSVTRKSSVKI